MTTEINEPRNISELLELKSYSEMSDDEVEIVIQWRVEKALAQSVHTAKLQSIKEQGEARIAEAKEQREHAQSILEALVAKPLDLYVAGDNNDAN